MDSNIVNQTVSQSALDALSSIESGKVGVEDVLRQLIDIVSDCLTKYQVVANTQNAGQITDLMLATLYPEAPLSSIVLNCMANGTMPSFSEDAPEEYSIHRAISCFADGVFHSNAEDAPIDEAFVVINHIEKSGYLPNEYCE